MSEGLEQLSFDVAEKRPAEPAAPAPEAAPDAGPPTWPAPTAEQAAAIDARDRDVFLEAGAGTGKTRVLVDRYCDAVDLDGVEPERILAFTFTEKAAAEMRRRVRVELLRRSRTADDEERRIRLQDAARAGEGAAITTIHGFCRRLLASHPVAAGLDPGFRVLDADEASRLASVAFESALADLAGRDDDVAAVAAAYRGRRLRGLIKAAYDDLRNHGHSRPDLPPLQISAFEGKGRKETPATPEELELAEASYSALRSLLLAYGERYAAIKTERSGVDFDDLQILSLELLGGSDAVSRAQRERFDHLLVDEFQDTSPLQIGLISALRGPGCRLFTVGDEFQSIYAFRGADLESFRSQRREAEQRSSVLALSGSFRSTPPVVAAVNEVGRTLLEDFRELRVGRLPEPGAPGLDAGADPAIELLLTRHEGWRDEGPELRTAAAETAAERIAEARRLALRLRELVDEEGVAPGSIVLLLRAFTNVDAYAEALELAGLDPYVVGGRGYWSSQQVDDALRLLACVANPLDDAALFGALASPAAAVSPDALWLLRRAAGRGRHVWPTLRSELVEDARGREQADEPLDVEAAEALAALEPTDREALGRFGAALLDVRAGAAQMPLDTLVESTLESFDYDLAALSMSGGRRRVANLLKLVRMAAEYEAHEGRDLRGFLAWVAARAALSDREAEAATAAEDHDGVTVMTVHAAKGLEFDCVAVADLGRGHTAGGMSRDLPMAFDGAGSESGEDGAPGGPRVGLRLARAGAGSLTVDGYNSITDAAAVAESQETGRLVYVAASRARERLILSGIYKAKEADGEERDTAASHSTIRRLLPALGIVDDGESEGFDVELPAPAPREDLEAEFEPARLRVRFSRASDAGAAGLAYDLRESAPAAAPAPGGTPPLTVLSERGASAARSLSYAALAEYSRCGYRFLTERVLALGARGAASAPGPGSGAQDESRARLGFGRAVHELLEAAALGDWRRPDPGVVEAALVRQGADPGRAGEATELLDRWLASGLLAGLREEGAKLRPEAGFRLDLGAGTLLRGTIDLLAEGPEIPGGPGDVPTVIDYKTDASLPVGGSLPPAYEIQRDLYACAIAAARGADTVRTAYVFLRSPDDPILETLDADAIAAGRERIGGLVERIRERDFAPTSLPHRALCHDCPARPRLCPHPPEATGSDLAEAIPEERAP